MLIWYPELLSFYTVSKLFKRNLNSYRIVNVSIAIMSSVILLYKLIHKLSDVCSMIDRSFP